MPFVISYPETVRRDAGGTGGIALQATQEGSVDPSRPLYTGQIYRWSVARIRFRTISLQDSVKTILVFFEGIHYTLRANPGSERHHRLGSDV